MKKSTIAYGVAAVLAFAFVLSLPAMFALNHDELWYSNSILSFLLWFAAFGLIKCILQHDFTGKRKRWLVPALFSLIFSICMVFGASLETRESITFTDGSLWMSILALTVNFTLIVRFLFDQLKQKERMKEGTGCYGQVFKREETPVKSFLIRTGIIFLCYVPVFLAVYPGFFVYDAQDELMQVITRNFSTHHPLFHVLFMGGVIQLVYKITGSYNLGIACYTLLQMVVLSLVFAFVIGILQREGLKKKSRAVLALYFGLCPVLAMFALCSAKDGLFAGMLLLQLMMLREFVKDPEQFLQRKGPIGFLFFSSLFMMLLRHNGLYGFAVFAVLMFLLIKKVGFTRQWKKAALLFAGIMVGYLLVSNGLTALLRADDSENQEILTVPIQQMARVHEMEGDSLTEEDKNTLYEILSQEALARYTPKVSDGVKIDFNNEAYSQNPGKYLRLWLKWGVEHPFTYINAWFMTSYGFWYPDTVIDVYRGNSVFTFTYEDSSYFGYEVELPGERQSKLPFLDEVYRRLSLEITQQKIPVISMLFSPGFLFWVMAFFLCFLWYQGKIKEMTPYLLPLLIWLTFLLGPTYLVRYVVYLWCILPILLCDVKKSLQTAGFDN